MSSKERLRLELMMTCCGTTMIGTIISWLGDDALGVLLIYGALAVAFPIMVWMTWDWWREDREQKRHIAELRRTAEVNYLEWLHDASPDD